MIDYKELRVGNWVIMCERTDRVRCDAKVMQVTNVSKEGYNFHHPASMLIYNWEWFEPIPLTPEVLKKCGAIFDKSAPYTNKRFAVDFNLNDDCLHFYWNGRKLTFSGFDIHYFHQLQNLYHSLTGEELTYTP